MSNILNKVTSTSIDEIKSILEEKYETKFSESFCEDLVQYMSKYNMGNSIDDIIVAAKTFDFINDCGFINKETTNDNDKTDTYIQDSKPEVEFSLSKWIKEILSKKYGEEVSEENICSFITDALVNGSNLASKEEVISIFEKLNYAQKFGVVKEEKISEETTITSIKENISKDVILDVEYYVQLTDDGKLKYLRNLISNIENTEKSSLIGRNVTIRRNGEIKEFPKLYLPLYQEYIKEAKNLKKKISEEINGFLEEDREAESNSVKFNNMENAILVAQEKLEAEKFEGAETLEEVYEKICLLKKQKNKDEKTKRMIKIYKNKLCRLAHKKNAMFAMKWNKLIIKKIRKPLHRENLKSKIDRSSKKFVLNIVDIAIKDVAIYNVGESDLNQKQKFRFHVKEVMSRIENMDCIQLENEIKRASYFLENSNYLLHVCGNNYQDFLEVLASLRKLRNSLKKELYIKFQTETRSRV